MQRTASLLLTLPLFASSVIPISRGTTHLSLDWPVHAHHHLVHQLFLWTGLPILGLLLVWIPLQRGELWAKWALLLIGLCLYGGYWVGNLTIGLGEPATIPNTSQAIQALIYSTGLIVAWRSFGDSTPRS